VKISITLPCLYPDLLDRAVANINATTRLPHEILVVGPFEAKGDNVVWIREDKPRGVAYAQHVAGMAATGDFVAASADDYDFVDGWDDILLTDFLDRERLHGVRYVMGMRYAIDNLVGTTFGMYYPNFPFMRRSSIEYFGWISPEYKRGFGDCDLGMRVWDRGGVCEFSAAEILKPVRNADGSLTLDDQRKRSLAEKEDLELFVRRWGGKYGEGWDTSHLRGFNFDLDITFYGYVLSHGRRSIYHNEPDFKALIGNTQGREN
jgi:hypothetical protein